MNEFLSPERLAELGNLFYQWILDNVLVLDNAVQLAVVAMAWGVALLTSRRLKPLLERQRSRRGAARVVDVGMPVLLPLIWLALQWLAIATARPMKLSPSTKSPCCARCIRQQSCACPSMARSGSMS